MDEQQQAITSLLQEYTKPSLITFAKSQKVDHSGAKEVIHRIIAALKSKTAKEIGDCSTLPSTQKWYVSIH
jgi:hypothetical protein